MKNFTNLLLILTFVFTNLSFSAKASLDLGSANQVINACEEEAKYDKSSLILVLNNDSENVSSIDPLSNSVATINLLVNHNTKSVLDNSYMNNPKLSTLIFKANLDDTEILSFPEVSDCHQINEIISYYSNQSNVKSVSLNYINSRRDIPSGNPNDPKFDQQWGLKRINANKIWNKTTGDGVLIGVIDVSLFGAHNDLKNQIVFNDSDSLADTSWNTHGTHVSGIALSEGDNNRGVVGIAPYADLAFTSYGSGSSAEVIDSILYLMSNNVDVINMSFGFYISSSNSQAWQNSSLFQLIESIIDSGVNVVVAAGNDNKDVGSLNQSSGSFDAYSVIPGVISVASTTSSNQKANHSNFGANVDIAAPGEDIISTYFTYSVSSGLKETYANLDGTSMAAPHVTGAVALLKAYKPNLTAMEIQESLKESAATLSGQNIGGLLDLEAAINYVDDNFANIGDFDITNPGANYEIHETKPTFTWTKPKHASPYGVSYNIKLIRLSDESVLIDENLYSSLYGPTPNSYEAQEPLVDGNYKVIVTANEQGFSSNQAYVNFSVKAEVTTQEILDSLVIRSNNIFFNNSRTLFEKTLYSPLTTKWYYILPNGNLYQSVSSGRTSTMLDGSDILIEQIDSKYYRDLRNLYQLRFKTLEEIVAVHDLDLEIANETVYLNYSRSKMEKWLKGSQAYASSAKTWYEVLPNGDLLSSKVPGEVLIELDSFHYTDIGLVVARDLTDTQILQIHNYHPGSTGNISFNWSGQYFEKWFLGQFGNPRMNSWTTIRPGGFVYSYDGVEHPVAVMKLDQSFYIDPSKFESITDSSNEFFVKMNQLDIKLETFKDDHDYNWGGLQEKWLKGAKKTNEASQPYYYILPDGSIYRFKGSKANMKKADVLVTKVDANYYVDPNLLNYN